MHSLRFLQVAVKFHFFLSLKFFFLILKMQWDAPFCFLVNESQSSLIGYSKYLRLLIPLLQILGKPISVMVLHIEGRAYVSMTFT